MNQPPDRPAAAPPAGFFASVRRLGLWRTDDRWIGGVAAGLAHRMGIDPVIVRGLFVVTAIFGGLGLLLYGAAWALLPEASDGRIHLEEAIRGRFDIALVGAIAFFVIGLSNPVFWWDGSVGWSLSWLIAVGAVVGVVALVLSQRRSAGPPPAGGPHGTGPHGTDPHGTGPYGGPPAPPPPTGTQPPAPDTSETPMTTTGESGLAATDRHDDAPTDRLDATDAAPTDRLDVASSTSSALVTRPLPAVPITTAGTEATSSPAHTGGSTGYDLGGPDPATGASGPSTYRPADGEDAPTHDTGPDGAAPSYGAPSSYGATSSHSTGTSAANPHGSSTYGPAAYGTADAYGGGGGWGPGGPHQPGPAEPAEPPAPVRVVPGPGSRVTSAVLALCLLAAAGLTLANHAGVLDGSLWLLAGGTVLTLLGLGVVLSGILGRRQGGIGLLGFFVALVMVPSALLAATVPGLSRIGWDGWTTSGGREFVPTTVASAESGTTLGAGRLVVDLTELDLDRADATGADADVTVPVEVGFGVARIIVPDDVGVTLDAEIGAGELVGSLGEDWTVDHTASGIATTGDGTGIVGGVAVDTRLVRPGTPHITIVTEVGFGQIVIEEQS